MALFVPVPQVWLEKLKCKWYIYIISTKTGLTGSYSMSPEGSPVCVTQNTGRVKVWLRNFVWFMTFKIDEKHPLPTELIREGVEHNNSVKFTRNPVYKLLLVSDQNCDKFLWFQTTTDYKSFSLSQLDRCWREDFIWILQEISLIILNNYGATICICTCNHCL